MKKPFCELKKKKPSRGAPKIREIFIRKYPDIRSPAKSTVHAILAKHGLVNSHRKRRHTANGTILSHPVKLNDLWCVDYKGEFLLGNKKYCYLLTISDFSTRYLFACEGLESTKEQYAFTVFERVFKEFGLPRAIRSDNGVPFSSPNALFGLSKLSVWWLRLGIAIERIKPGNPQQNGRHEHMHLTLKKETTKPSAHNILQQQAKFDDLIYEYNYQRPHHSLNMKFPSALYLPSANKYNGLPELDYPFHDKIITVTHCGRICFKGRKINFSVVFAGQDVGIKEVDDNIWLVSFMNYDLGFFDENNCKIEPLNNPFGSKLLPISSV